MPFSSTRDAEHYWRTRFGGPLAKNVSAFPGRKGSASTPPGTISPEAETTSFHGGAQPAPARRRRLFSSKGFPGAKLRRRWFWVFAGSALATAILFFLPMGEKGMPRPEAMPIEAALPAPSFETSLGSFLDAHEASMVALRGFLLTDGDGFRTEWLEATRRMQAALEALDADSANWTDGKRLVELEEVKRLASRLLSEEWAVAAIVRTANRYPGLQIFREDVLPALGEAQEQASNAMSAMLAVSSPENVGPVGPFAAFRGELEILRDDLERYAASPKQISLPESATAPAFDTLRGVLSGVRGETPDEARPRIDRLVMLLATVQEKLQRIQALKESDRWDYAAFAYETRIMPLAGRLEEILLGWKTG